MKTELCEAQNYRLIHIWEDEWNNNKDEIKLKLKSIFENKEVITNDTQLDRSWYTVLSFSNKNFEILPPTLVKRGNYFVENCGYIIIKKENYKI